MQMSGEQVKELAAGQAYGVCLPRKGPTTVLYPARGT